MFFYLYLNFMWKNVSYIFNVFVNSWALEDSLLSPFRSGKEGERLWKCLFRIWKSESLFRITHHIHSCEWIRIGETKGLAASSMRSIIILLIIYSWGIRAWVQPFRETISTAYAIRICLSIVYPEVTLVKTTEYFAEWQRYDVDSASVFHILWNRLTYLLIIHYEKSIVFSVKNSRRKIYSFR